MAAAPKVLRLSDLQSNMQDFSVWREQQKVYDLPQYAVPVTPIGAVQVPVYATQAQILQYLVRPNWACIIRGIVFGFQGSGTPPNPTDATFVVDIDRPLNTLEGYPEKDFGAVPVSLGSLGLGLVWPVTFRHENGETIRIKATANANMGTGAGNYFVGALIGWEWPKEND